MVLFFRNNNLRLPLILIRFKNAVDLFDNFRYIVYSFVILPREGPEEDGSLLKI